MVTRDGDLTKAQGQWNQTRATSDAHQNLSEGQQAGYACRNVTQQSGLRSGNVFSSTRRRRDYWTFYRVTGAGGLGGRHGDKAPFAEIRGQRSSPSDSGPTTRSGFTAPIDWRLPRIFANWGSNRGQPLSASPFLKGKSWTRSFYAIGTN